MQVELEFAIHQVTAFQNLSGFQRDGHRCCIVGVDEADGAIGGDILIGGNLCEHAACFHLGNRALMQLLVCDMQHTAVILHHFQTYMEGGLVIGHAIGIANSFGDLVMVNARGGEGHCREFELAGCVVSHRLADLLAVDGIDQPEFELAGLHGTAFQYLLATEIGVDIIGDGLGHKAVAEHDSGRGNAVLFHSHTGIQHASGIVGNGDRNGVNGCVVIVACVTAVHLGQGVDIHTSLFKDDVTEVDHAPLALGIGHSSGGGHGCAIRNCAQAEGELTVLHGLTGEDLLTFERQCHGGCIVLVGEHDLIRSCAGGFLHRFDGGNGCAQGGISIIHNADAHFVHGLIVGEAANGVGIQFLDAVQEVAHCRKFNGREAEAAVCIVINSGLCRHGCAGGNSLQNECKLACIEYPIAADDLFTGNGDEVGSGGNIGVGEGCLTGFHCAAAVGGNHCGSGNGSVAHILYGHVNLVDCGIVSDVGVAGVDFCQVVGKHSAFHGCTVGCVIQGDACLAVGAGHIGTENFGSLCQIIAVQQYELEACKAVTAIHLLLDIHSDRSGSSGLVDIVEGCGNQICTGNSGVDLIVDGHDLQVAIHILVSYHHAEATLSGVVGDATLAARLLGDAVIVGARLRIDFGRQAEQMALVSIGLVNHSGGDHSGSTAYIQPLQLEGVAFAVHPLSTIAGDGLADLYLYLPAVGSGGIVGVDDQCLVVGSSIHDAAQATLLFIQAEAIGDIGLHHGIAGHFGNAANHKRSAIGQSHGKFAVRRNGQSALGRLEASGNRLAGGIGQGDLCGEGNAVSHIHSCACCIHHLLGDDQVAFAHSGVDEVHLIDVVSCHLTDCHSAHGNAVYMDGLDLVILVAGDFFNGVGRAGGELREPEALIPFQIYGIHAAGGNSDLRGCAQRHNVQCGGPAVQLAGEGGSVGILDGDTEGEGIGGAGLKNIHGLGKLDALCRSDLQKAVVTQVHVHVEYAVLLGQIGVEDHVGRLGCVLIGLLLIIHPKLTGGRAGRNHPCANIIGQSDKAGIPAGCADGGSRHFLIVENGLGGGFGENVTAVIILTLRVQGAICTLALIHQHIAVAALFEHGGVKGEVEALVLLGRGERSQGNLVIIMICRGNIKIVAPELTGHAIVSNVLGIGDSSDVQLVQVRTQAAFKHQADGTDACGILDLHLYIGSGVHIGTL